MKLLSKDQLENTAASAPKYSNYGEYPVYIGQGDPLLNFQGDTGNFAAAARESKIFTMTIANSDTNPHACYLCPGLVPSETGLVNDGAFNDIANAAGLTGTADPSGGRIKDFVWFIQKFPSVCAGIKLYCANAAQMTQNLTLVKKSPFHQAASKIINTGVFQSMFALNQNILEVEEPFFMDQSSAITYNVLASTTVVISFFIGVSYDITQDFATKVAVGKANVQQLGGPAAVTKAIGQ
jgi:hypothetical protein